MVFQGKTSPSMHGSLEIWTTVPACERVGVCMALVRKSSHSYPEGPKQKGSPLRGRDERWAVGRLKGQGDLLWAGGTSGN